MPDGSLYTYRIYTDINNVKTETIYSECCSLPLKITGVNMSQRLNTIACIFDEESSTKGGIR